MCNKVYTLYLDNVWINGLLEACPKEIGFETEISCRKFSGECEAVRKAGFGRGRSKTAIQVQERPQQLLKLRWPFRNVPQMRQRGKFSVSPYPPITAHRKTKERRAQPWARQLPSAEGNFAKSKTYSKGYLDGESQCPLNRLLEFSEN